MYIPIKHCPKNISNVNDSIINNFYHLINKKDTEYIMNSEQNYKDIFNNICIKYSNLIMSYEYKVFISKYQPSVFVNIGNIFYDDLINLNNEILHIINNLPKNNLKNIFSIFVVKCIQYSTHKFIQMAI